MTTFAAAGYIIVVNPTILAATGRDREALMVATIVASILGTLAVGLRANLPVALAPGMGVNSIFASLIVGRLGFSWQTGLAVVFVTGLLFLALSLTRMRAGIVAGFPPPIKVGIQGAIGVFVAFVERTASGIVVGRPTTLVALGNLADPGTALAGVLAMPVLFAARARRHPTGHRRRHAGLPPRPRCGGAPARLAAWPHAGTGLLLAFDFGPFRARG